MSEERRDRWEKQRKSINLIGGKLMEIKIVDIGRGKILKRLFL